MRRPQPVGRGHAPWPRSSSCFQISPGRTGARRASPIGEVKKEAVYLTPTSKTKLRIPTPPPFKNHGNEVISVSALARYQQRVAEEAGAYILTETSATQLIVEDGRVVGVRSGDKGRGKDGEPLGNFEPGTDIKAQATVLAEGCWGHLTGAAIREFDLVGRARAAGVGARRQGGLEGPQAARPPDPHGRAVAGQAVRQVRAGRRHLALSDEGREDGRRPRLDRLRRRARVRRRDDVRPRPAAAVQDPPVRPQDPRGRRAGRVGREGAARRRLLVDAEALDAGRAARRRRRRDGRHGGAQGRPPLDQLRQARGGGDLPRRSRTARRRSSPTSRRSRSR